MSQDASVESHTRFYSRSEITERRQLERLCQVLLRVPHVLLSLLRVASVETFLAPSLVCVFASVHHERTLVAKCVSMAVAQAGASGETLLRESTLPVAVMTHYARDAWEPTLAKMAKAVGTFVTKHRHSIEIDADRTLPTENVEANLQHYVAFLDGATSVVCNTLCSVAPPVQLMQVVLLLNDVLRRHVASIPSRRSHSMHDVLSHSGSSSGDGDDDGALDKQVVAAFVFLHLIVPALSTLISTLKTPEARRKVATLCRTLQHISCAPSTEHLVASSITQDVSLQMAHISCWQRLQQLVQYVGSTQSAHRRASSDAAPTQSRASRSLRSLFSRSASKHAASSALTRSPTLSTLPSSPSRRSSRTASGLSEQDINHVPKKLLGSEHLLIVWSYCANHREQLETEISQLEDISRIDVQTPDLATLMQDILSTDSEPMPDFRTRDVVCVVMRKILCNNMSLLWQSEGVLSIETNTTVSESLSEMTVRFDVHNRSAHHTDCVDNDDDDGDDELESIGASSIGGQRALPQISLLPPLPSTIVRTPTHKPLDTARSNASEECLDYTVWSPEELSEYLARFIGEQSSQVFVEHRVQGIDFVDLSRDELTSLGITQLGVIKAIERAKTQLLSNSM
jgi:hypothetical protein